MLGWTSLVQSRPWWVARRHSGREKKRVRVGDWLVNETAFCIEMAGLTGLAHRRSRHKIAETSTQRVFQPDFLSRNLLTSRSDVLSPYEQWPRQGEQENPVQNQSDEDESAAPLATKAHKEELYRSCHLQSNAHRTARPLPDKKIQTNQVNPRLYLRPQMSLIFQKTRWQKGKAQGG